MKIHKNMMNLEIAELLRDVAAAYKLKDAAKNQFRIIAYERAGDAVEHLSSEAKDLWDDKKLEGVAGIGASIAGHLDEIFKTGKSKHFDKVMKGLPPAMFDIMKVPGIGAKTAYKLTTSLKISGKDPIGRLEKAVKAGKIEVLEGMGKDTQEAILKSIKEVKGRTVRLLLPYASQIADEIIVWLKTNKTVKRADVLGSLRRKASTVGDVDIAVSTSKSTQVLDHFTKYPKATRTLEKGDRTASIIIPGNRQVDLMVETPQAYGALLQHFTGSKHHNVALREFALKRNLSLSDYGIKPLRGKTQNSKLKTQKYNSKLKVYQIPNEEKFYEILGMDWIPPELREGTEEIKAALDHKLPRLVEIKDIKADLQIHSSYDIETSHDLGESTMNEIVKKADSLGYEYIAFTEHNPSKSGHNKKQIIDILKRKKETVEKKEEKVTTEPTVPKDEADEAAKIAETLRVLAQSEEIDKATLEKLGGQIEKLSPAAQKVLVDTPMMQTIIEKASEGDIVGSLKPGQVYKVGPISFKKPWRLDDLAKFPTKSYTTSKREEWMWNGVRYVFEEDELYDIPEPVHVMIMTHKSDQKAAREQI
ncbi:hypothetical protein IID22_04880, partial [Patescibacteria group bacterium]|nr:hypothetical protein [Patescibacteria group bacterium]